MLERDLTPEVEAFLRQRAALRARYAAQWVVFSGEEFRGAFSEYEGAARFAIEHFADSPFLVRNVDAEDEQVPLIFAEPQ